MLRRLVLGACIVAIACNDSTTITPSSTILAVAIDSGASPIQRSARVTLDKPGGVTVRYTRADGATLQIDDTVRVQQHEVFLPRLYASSSYSIEAFALGGAPSGKPSATAAFHTGALPPDVAALKFEAQGRPTLPLTQIEVMITSTGFAGSVIVDSAGNVVWFQRGSGGFITGMTRRANGNLVILDADSGLVEIKASGEVVHRLAQTQAENPYGNIHHDVVPTPQNTLYFFAREKRLVRDTMVVGEAIWEWNPEANSVVKKWSAFDFLDWSVDRGDRTVKDNWLHGNALWIGSRGNIIASFRNADEVISIASDFKSIEWKLHANALGGALALDPDDRFYGQHGVMETAPNRIVLFDNGAGRPTSSPYSRALELNVDVAGGKATRVWQFRPAQDINAIMVGSTRRLANGNTMVAFGWGPGSPIIIYEVTPAGQIVYQLSVRSGIDRLYRATPLASIGGEH